MHHVDPELLVTGPGKRHHHEPTRGPGICADGKARPEPAGTRPGAAKPVRKFNVSGPAKADWQGTRTKGGAKGVRGPKAYTLAPRPAAKKISKPSGACVHCNFGEG